MLEWGLGLILITFMTWAVWSFNRLIRLRNQVSAAWSDIDVQLARRHDLVPRLVDVVRAYAAHERSLLAAVTTLRSQAVQNTRPTALAGLEDALEKHLNHIFLLQEAYPGLKADANFAQLQRDLVETENLLQYARRFYNGAVRELNNGVQQFPHLIIAKLFRIGIAEFYIAAPESRENPRVVLE